MASVNLKLDNMRKEDSFSIYPVTEGETTVVVQGGSRIGEFDLKTGAGVLSQRVAGGAYFMHLTSFMGAKPYTLTAEQLKAVQDKLSNTGATMRVGMMVADNSGAVSILA